MTLRDEIHERIDQLDDAALQDIIRELNDLEQRNAGEFSKEFMDTLKEVRKQNKDDDPDLILKEVSEAVNEVRQTPHC